ncbi:MAG: helix-turn-helix domain-containing protein [Chloroflexota bacterium]
MSQEIVSQTPQTVIKALEISSATLRRWSDEFSDYLSPEATGGAEGRSHRRYNEEDLTILGMVKELMNRGMTYQQVRQQLAEWSNKRSDQITRIVPPDEMADDYGEMGMIAHDETGLVSTNGSEETAVAFLNNTLTTLSDTQKSILNSQAANRELLGVVIQDNFNLKEENNRLRERVMDVERNMVQVRQEEEWRREALRQEMDAKLTSIQQMASDALVAANSVEAPELKAVRSKAGCLGSLFGAGEMQIISVPGRKRGSQDDSPTQQQPAAGSMPPVNGTTPASSSLPPGQAFHPKPTRPPE